MGWAIICTSESYSDVIQINALVDRNKTKKKWWTESSSDFMMEFRSKSAAQKHVKDHFDMGNPRVVDFEEAKKRIELQQAYLIAKGKSGEIFS